MGRLDTKLINAECPITAEFGAARDAPANRRILLAALFCSRRPLDGKRGLERRTSAFCGAMQLVHGGRPVGRINVNLSAQRLSTLVDNGFTEAHRAVR